LTEERQPLRNNREKPQRGGTDQQVTAVVTPLLSDPQATAYLGLKDGTMAAWRSRNVGPAWHRVGRRVMYDVADLRAYVAAGRVETASVT
jgi:hypothetical protein